MSFLHSSWGTLRGSPVTSHWSSGSHIQAIPFWYSDRSPISQGRTVGLVPMSAGFLAVLTCDQSTSGSVLDLISLTRVPTNSRKEAESFFNMPSTEVESVKNRTDRNFSFTAAFTFSASRTAIRDPTSSTRGMEILHLGATLVFPATSRHL